MSKKNIILIKITINIKSLRIIAKFKLEEKDILKISEIFPYTYQLNQIN